MTTPDNQVLCDPFATVTGLNESRDIAQEKDAAGNITGLKPVPGNLRSSITLTFPHGESLELPVESADFARIVAAHERALEQEGSL